MAHLRSRRDSLILRASLLFLLAAVFITLGRSWLHRETVPAPRSHALFRVVLPGLDAGADAWPARPGQAGYIELWIAPHDADDIQTILQLIGSPPLPRPYDPSKYILAEQEHSSTQSPISVTSWGA